MKKEREHVLIYQSKKITHTINENETYRGYHIWTASDKIFATGGGAGKPGSREHQPREFKLDYRVHQPQTFLPALNID